MEKFGLGKSIASTSTDHRSASGTLMEGNRQVQRQITILKSASGSRAQNSNTIAENWGACESSWRSSNSATGIPIKKLLEKEMARETEPRRRSPGVIAKLMGFDGLPPQQLSRKQPKMSEESHQLRVTSIDRSQKSSASCSHRSSRKSSKEEQEFKDVFEVLNSSRMESIFYSLKDPSKPKLTEAEMTYVKQKFQDMRRLSTDSKLYDTEEVHDAIEDLQSNQDLLLKYLEEPDSLFTKHLHDLHPDSLPPNHITSMKLLNALKHEGCDASGKKRVILLKHRKNDNNSHGHSNNKHSAEKAHLRSPEIQVEGKIESSVFPRRIVVLKPNFKKVQNVSSPQSSHGFLSDCEEHHEHSSTKEGDEESCAKERVSNDAASPRYKLRESKEIARRIARQMRNNLERHHTKASGFKGYAGDESSSDNESANESDASSLVSRNSMHRSNQWKPSSSHSTESPVSKEARVRISERWKTTNKSVDMIAVGRSSTLAEMLAMPEKEGRPANADAVVNDKGFTANFVGMYRPIGSIEPLGISSRDGWKDGCIRNLSRSRSVPASCTTTGSPRSGMPPVTRSDERFLLPKEMTPRERIKLAKGNFDHPEASSRTSRSHAKGSHFSVYSYTDCSDSSPEIQFRRKKVQNDTIEGDRIEDAVGTNSRLVSQDSADVEIENAALPSEPEVDAVSSAYPMAQENSSTVPQESSLAPPEKGCIPENTVTVVESRGSSKDAEQPSPVSVLETSFPDDPAPSSESFENLSSDIHGLWKQIQLLKSEESEVYGERDTVISQDEVNEPLEERENPEETEELRYMKDMFTESGINFIDHDSFIASLHSSECPVDPLVFEELERDWSLGTWTRCERKLLFDRVNSALVVLKRQFGETRPWVNVGNRSAKSWIENGVEERVLKLLEIDEKKAYEQDEVATVSKWVELEDEMDGVGKHIEKMIIKELMEEMIEEMRRRWVL